MKVFRLAAVIALLTGPAYAQQMPNINLIPETTSKTPEQQEQEAIQQKAYKESLKKIPDAKTSSDPWGTVRSNDAPKTAAPAKPIRCKNAIAASLAARVGLFSLPRAEIIQAGPSSLSSSAGCPFRPGTP